VHCPAMFFIAAPALLFKRLRSGYCLVASFLLRACCKEGFGNIVSNEKRRILAEIQMLASNGNKISQKNTYPKYKYQS
jgi:hypothetical protein